MTTLNDTFERELIQEGKGYESGSESLTYYTAFFYRNSAQQLQNLPEEILFGHFMTTLNDTFERELIQEGKGYESGSESFGKSLSNGLYRCSYNWYTITSCTTRRRPQEDVNTHQRGTTFKNALTSFIRGYTLLL